MESAPGEILVSEQSFEQLSDTVSSAGERVLELKGISKPVRAYSLT